MGRPEPGHGGQASKLRRRRSGVWEERGSAIARSSSRVDGTVLPAAVRRVEPDDVLVAERAQHVELSHLPAVAGDGGRPSPPARRGLGVRARAMSSTRLSGFVLSRIFAANRSPVAACRMCLTLAKCPRPMVPVSTKSSQNSACAARVAARREHRQQQQRRRRRRSARRRSGGPCHSACARRGVAVRRLTSVSKPIVSTLSKAYVCCGGGCGGAPRPRSPRPGRIARASGLSGVGGVPGPSANASRAWHGGVE